MKSTIRSDHTLRRPRFTEDVRPISDLKSKASAIIDHARTSKRPVLLTRRGRGVAVLIDLEEYEALADRAAFVRAVDEGAEAARLGDLHDHDEAVAILDTFGT